MPLYIRFIAIAIATVAAWHNYKHINKQLDLVWHDDDIWYFIHADQHISGKTAVGGYRSSFVVIIAIRPDTGLRHYVMVWRDAVPPADFSWLQIRIGMTPGRQLT